MPSRPHDIIVQSTIRSLQSAVCKLPENNPQHVVGFLTAYVPEEIFHAAGLTPVFIFPATDDQGYARAHLPGFACWVASSALDQALASHLDSIVGMALSKTCDTTQGLADLWPRNVPDIPLLHFGMPSRLGDPITRTYLLAELRSLGQRIQETLGRPVTDDALQGSIVLYNRTRTLVRRLYRRAADLDSPDLYELVRAAFQTPKETYNRHVAHLLDHPIVSLPQKKREKPARVVLVGPELPPPTLFNVIDQAGAHVVGDLLDLGERYFAADAAEEDDPFQAIADRLMTLVPTPTKHHSQHSRADHLLSLVKERDADGVIFACQKFCDPYGFDYVQLAHALDQEKTPHLLIELEQASQIGQLSTRVEAFLEMLHQR